MSRAAHTSALPIALACVLSIVLTGCGIGGDPDPSTSSPGPASSAAPESEPSGEPTVDPSEAPADEVVPQLVPAGTADDNLPYFNDVNERFFTDNPTPGGRAIIDNLVAAGFDKATMQVTPDSTSIGRDADSVQFSVRFGEECVIGQSGGGEYVGIVGPAASGTCLIGITRAIDW